MKTFKSIRINEYLLLLYRFAILMLVYSVLRFIFWRLNSDIFEVEMSEMKQIMWGGMRFDVSALIYLNIIYFALYIGALWGKFKRGYMAFLNWLFYIINGIGIALNCIDIVYYRFILKRTTFNVFDILANETNWVQLTIQAVVDYWYVLIVFVVVIVLFISLIKRVEPVITPIKNRVVYVVVAVAVLAIVGTLSVAGMRGGFRHSTRPITLSNAAAYVDSPEKGWIVLNTPFCIIRTVGKKSFVRYSYFSEEELDREYTPVHTEVVDTLPMRKKNVVVFILESFSREFLGRFNLSLENGSYQGYTPFLDSLANESLIFTNAFANGRKSIDAMPSVLASIPSLTMPYIVSEYSNNKVNSIASLLNAEGYETAFFHGAPNGSMGFDAFARIAEFDRYYGKDEYDNDEDFDGIWGIWDDKFFCRYADELSGMEQPFCTALFSLSSHHPYKVPAEYEGMFRKGPLPLEQCINYTDYSLKLFFEKAKKESWFENTLFVITADHSITPEHAEYKNNAMAFAVPIIFYAPGDTTLRGEDERLAQQADIMPSVLAYLGYKKPFVSFGINLFSENEERFVVNYLNGVYQIYIEDYIAYFDGEKLVAVYDMKNDPMLEKNIIETIETHRIETKIKAYVQQYNVRMIDNNLTIGESKLK